MRLFECADAVFDDVTAVRLVLPEEPHHVRALLKLGRRENGHLVGAANGRVLDGLGRGEPVAELGGREAATGEVHEPPPGNFRTLNRR